MWPEQGYAITWTDLLNETARFLGYREEERPYMPTYWTSEETRQVRRLALAGVRQALLSPPAVPDSRGIPRVHRWSFLRPITTLVLWGDTTDTYDETSSSYNATTGRSQLVVDTAGTFVSSMQGHEIVFSTSGNSYTILEVVSGVQVVVQGDVPTNEADGDTVTLTADGDYLLPEDFGFMEGKLYHEPSEGYSSISRGSESQILQYRQFGSGSGVPFISAVVPVVDDGSGQRWKLMVFPIPSGNRTVYFRYMRCLPTSLRPTTPHPPGGPFMAEVYLSSCRAAAELEAESAHGAQYQDFLAKMISAVAMDLRQRPDFLGGDLVATREAMRAASPSLVYLLVNGVPTVSEA